jgi:cytochrome c oxidase subunit II
MLLGLILVDLAVGFAVVRTFRRSGVVKNIPNSILTMLAGIFLTAVSFWYGTSNGLLPAAASAEAPLIDGLFTSMMVIGTGLFLLVVGVLLVSAIKFRAQPGDTSDGPNIHGNIPLEILWTGIPAVLVLGIAVYSFDVYNEIGGLNPMDHSAMAHGKAAVQVASQSGAAIAAPLPTAPDAAATHGAPSGMNMSGTNMAGMDMAQANPVNPNATGPTTIGQSGDDLKISAMGLQYAWLFTYPEAGITVGELHVPVGRTVDLSINAQDVLHAFWVPEYRLKQDAVPGRETGLRFTPTIPGEYPVICAELCGPYHGIMRTKVVAETPENYAAWVEEQKTTMSAHPLATAIAAADPHHKSTDEFLAPAVQSLGISPDTLSNLAPPTVTSHHP